MHALRAAVLCLAFVGAGFSRRRAADRVGRHQPDRRARGGSRVFAASGGDSVRFNFAGSNVLARQLANGAPADLFISADEAQMDVAERAGAIDSASRVDLLGNRLAVITREDAGSSIRTVDDLLRPEVTNRARRSSGRTGRCLRPRLPEGGRCLVATRVEGRPCRERSRRADRRRERQRRRCHRLRNRRCALDDRRRRVYRHGAGRSADRLSRRDRRAIASAGSRGAIPVIPARRTGGSHLPPVRLYPPLATR